MRVISQPKPDKEHRFTCRGCGAELAATPGDAHALRMKDGNQSWSSLTCCVCGYETYVSKRMTGWR